MDKVYADEEMLQLELFLRLREKGGIVWKTKKGDEIPIKQMGDNHLVNALRMLQRVKRSSNDEEFYDYLEKLQSVPADIYEA